MARQNYGDKKEAGCGEDFQLQLPGTVKKWSL
jgi:hypothetical protein